MKTTKHITLSIENLSFKYEDSSFVIKKYFANFENSYINEIVGENGSGKSTLLKLIATILKPTYGSIDFSIDSNSNIKPQKSIIYITHNSQLYQNLTVKESIIFFSKLYNIEFEKIKAFQEFFLEKFKNKKIKELSRGMAQFLNLIIGIEANRDIYLYDEPFSGLDKKRVEEVKEIIFNQYKNGKFIIFVSHSEVNFSNKKQFFI